MNHFCVVLWHRQGKGLKFSVSWRLPGAPCCFLSLAKRGDWILHILIYLQVQGGKDRGGDNSPCMTQSRSQYAILIENPPSPQRSMQKNRPPQCFSGIFLPLLCCRYWQSDEFINTRPLQSLLYHQLYSPKYFFLSTNVFVVSAWCRMFSPLSRKKMFLFQNSFVLTSCLPSW